MALYRLTISNQAEFTHLVEADSLEEAEKIWHDKSYEQHKAGADIPFRPHDSFLWGFAEEPSGTLWISAREEVQPDERVSEFLIIRR